MLRLYEGACKTRQFCDFIPSASSPAPPSSCNNGAPWVVGHLSLCFLLLSCLRFNLGTAGRSPESLPTCKPSFAADTVRASLLIAFKLRHNLGWRTSTATRTGVLQGADEYFGKDQMTHQRINLPSGNENSRPWLNESFAERFRQALGREMTAEERA